MGFLFRDTGTRQKPRQGNRPPATQSVRTGELLRPRPHLRLVWVNPNLLRP
jgi:hypothetical protein